MNKCTKLWCKLRAVFLFWFFFIYGKVWTSSVNCSTFLLICNVFLVTDFNISLHLIFNYYPERAQFEAKVKMKVQHEKDEMQRNFERYKADLEVKHARTLEEENRKKKLEADELYKRTVQRIHLETERMVAAAKKKSWCSNCNKEVGGDNNFQKTFQPSKCYDWRKLFSMFISITSFFRRFITAVGIQIIAPRNVSGSIGWRIVIIVLVKWCRRRVVRVSNVKIFLQQIFRRKFHQNSIIWELWGFLNFIHAGSSLFKVNNNTRTMCEICSKLTIETPERRLAFFWCCYC